MQRYGKDGRDRSLNTRRDDLEGALSLILVQLQGAARGLGEEKVKVVGPHDLEMRPVIPAGSSENKAVRIDIRHRSGRRRPVRGPAGRWAL